ncbi:MAG TPA: 4-hydroxythreonine-4-phosphate dehydrogenase PdxA, partial [Afifellaceae bacterium]|nr:4-hydroxythreonine-4-phosphate dehydrogenase PdxA [Afifellaceae bacterium]
MSAPAAEPPLLALTQGEPAGIGPDIAIEAWLARRRYGVPPFIFVGDPDLLARRATALRRDLPLVRVKPGEAAAAFDTALPCLDADLPPAAGRPGELAPREHGAGVLAAIRSAVTLVRRGEAGAIVTNPIHKKALSEVGFAHPGHTEFLGKLAEEAFGVQARPVMMLAGPGLRVVPVTIHIPLRTVPRALTTELIVATGRIVAEELTRRFAVAGPRLAVAGLNPHAGEDGLLGSEDEAVVAPAVAELARSGIDAVGPLSADTMFHDEARRRYDAALCMYHDQ